MTSSIPISAALLRNLAGRKWKDDDLARAFSTGEAHTRKASKGAAKLVSAVTCRFIRPGTRKHPTSPDKEASRRRRRSWAGSGMPRAMWKDYTEGERAVLCVVGDQVRRHGYCDLPIDRIAAVAGVSRTTCQNAMRKARNAERRHVTVEERPRAGRKNLTNIIRIVSTSWLAWLKRSIGFKGLSPTVAKEDKPSKTEPVVKLQEAYESTGAVTRDEVHREASSFSGSIDVNGTQTLNVDSCIHREMKQREDRSRDRWRAYG